MKINLIVLIFLIINNYPINCRVLTIKNKDGHILLYAIHNGKQYGPILTKDEIIGMEGKKNKEGKRVLFPIKASGEIKLEITPDSSELKLKQAKILDVDHPKYQYNLTNFYNPYGAMNFFRFRPSAQYVLHNLKIPEGKGDINVDNTTKSIVELNQKRD